MNHNEDSQTCECNKGYYRRRSCDADGTGGTCELGEDDICDACSIETYNPEPAKVGIESCLACPGNFDPGLDFCITCEAGELYNFDTGLCERCPEGDYRDPVSTDCKPCPAGTYAPSSPLASESQCAPCPVGTFNPDSGKYLESSCQPCGVGRYNELPGKAECAECDPGTYNDQPGQTSSSACKECEINYYSSTSGQGICVECEDGTFNGVRGSTDCLGICDKICLKCSGPSNTECYTCKPDIPRVIEVQEMECGCQKGYYYDKAESDPNSYCKVCDDFCSICDATGCLQCDDSDGVQLTEVSNKAVCLCNAPGYSAYHNEETDKMECALCDVLCSTCYGSLRTQCYSCNEALGAVLVGANTCGCASHFYYDSSAASCAECDVLCSDCTGPLSSQCVACNEAYGFSVQDRPGLCVPYCALLGEYFTSAAACVRTFWSYE